MRSAVSALGRLSLLAGLAACMAPAGAEEYIGLVRPAHELTLSMGVGGVVSQINVRHGQRVKARQQLLLLDDRMQEIEANRRKVVFEDVSELIATQQRVRALKVMYDDTRRVFEQTGSISRDEMSKLEIDYASARGRLEQIEAQKRRERLEYEGALQERQMRRLTTPLAGVVTRIEPKVGEWAKPGETLVALVDASLCYLVANVPLRSVQGLRTGMTLPLRFESAAGAPAVGGKVSFVSAVADPASGLVEIRVAFANPDGRVRAGIKGMLDLPAGGRP